MPGTVLRAWSRFICNISNSFHTERSRFTEGVSVRAGMGTWVCLTPKHILSHFAFVYLAHIFHKYVRARDALVCKLMHKALEPSTGCLRWFDGIEEGVWEDLGLGCDPSYLERGGEPASWLTWRFQSLRNAKPHFGMTGYYSRAVGKPGA